MATAKSEFTVTGTHRLRTGLAGRRDALKWLITGNPPTPFVSIPVNVGAVRIECVGAGGGGGTVNKSEDA